MLVGARQRRLKRKHARVSKERMMQDPRNDHGRIGRASALSRDRHGLPVLRRQDRSRCAIGALSREDRRLAYGQDDDF
jgi:hypothetical protein